LFIKQRGFFSAQAQFSSVMNKLSTQRITVILFAGIVV